MLEKNNSFINNWFWNFVFMFKCMKKNVIINTIQMHS